MLFANLLLLRLKNTLLEHVFAKFQTADTLILRHLIRFWNIQYLHHLQQLLLKLHEWLFYLKLHHQENRCI